MVKGRVELRTLRIGSDVSDFFELDEVVGLIKAGKVLLWVTPPPVEDEVLESGVRLVMLPPMVL